MPGKIDTSGQKEMLSILKEIRDKLSTVSSRGSLRGPISDPVPSWGRGPVADPAPDWGRYYPEELSHFAVSRPWIKFGTVADPAAPELLDKAKLAQIKIRQIDMVIAELDKQADFLKLQRDLLKQEYKIK